MNDELFRVVLHQVINEGRLETFKEMGERLVAANKGNEPDTLTYEYYVNEAGTDGWVVSTFANSEALLLHYVHSREMRFRDARNRADRGRTRVWFSQRRGAQGTGLAQADVCPLFAGAYGRDF